MQAVEVVKSKYECMIRESSGDGWWNGLTFFFSLEVLGYEWEVCGCARNSTIRTGDEQC